MFDLPLVTILLLTGFINLIGALAYAARIAGVRTRRIAMSFALFNILVLFSRTSNSFLGPFLAKRIETRIHDGSGGHLFLDMQLVLAAASVATRHARARRFRSGRRRGEVAFGMAAGSSRSAGHREVAVRAARARRA